MDKRQFLSFGLLIFTVLMLSCKDRRLLPVQPSTLNERQEVIKRWSPYLGVHTPGEAYTAYKEALSLMKSNGTLQGVRVDIVRSEGFGNTIIKQVIGPMGLDILGIVDNYYLIEDRDRIEAVMDQIIIAYPEIRTFQIGNEMTTIISPPISIDQYMEAFTRIYNHVQKNYQNIMLVTGSVLGSGERGPRDLERMVQLGLAGMTDSLGNGKVIIGINMYALEGSYFHIGVLNGSLKNFRVYITETGVNNSDLHVAYVLNEYPRIKTTYRAERMYWYTLYNGEFGPEMNFGLIRDFFGPNSPAKWQSPLFKILAGLE